MFRDITTVVFDVLGTLVDEPRGLRTAIVEAAGPPSDSEALLGIWQGHIEREQARIGRSERDYADTETLDREAALQVAEAAGLDDQARIGRLAAAAERLPPWDDSADGVARLAQRFRVLGLSNATTKTLHRLGAHAGLEWDLALSADAVRAYKPAPEVYALAVEAAGGDPSRALMVAAHAWDLRGAQAVGMRTAYVRRPVGDPPTPSDGFDGRFDGLHQLAAALI
ncbi:haloacid dehalogenase type II [Microbacterium oxydans]|uniref:haloacid dehalogenase type II n=1 Tax=Microbacterium sp. B19(2022) TaxID=2914045 RepID=UPI001431751A|nr:haloacid dehalogenase type II [Microbacterium sp. B19(2022)]NJI59725.1 haloacid dehalogenase type II [Microbacterium sp. B19(2022)]